MDHRTRSSDDAASLDALRRDLSGHRAAALTFRALLDRASLGFLVLQDDVVGYANPMAGSMLGRPSPDLVGLPLDGLLGLALPVDREEARLCVSPGPEGVALEQRAEVRVAAGRGALIALALRSSPLVFDGLPARLIELQDVTEERLQRTELQRMHDEMRAILAGVRDGLVVTDAFDQVVFANTAAADLLGFPAVADLREASGEALYQHVDLLERDGKRVAYLDSTVARASRDGTPVSTSLYLKRSDRGTIRFVTMASTPVLEAGRRVTRVVTVFEDLTDIQRVETERRRLETELLRAQKSDGLAVMAGGIAHDFNNLLMVIRGNVELALKDEVPPEELKPYIARIDQASERATDLARQMLAYTGRASLELGRVDLNELLRDMQSLLRAAVSRKAHLSLKGAKDLPAVSGDAARLRQVVLNLARNASDALGSEPGDIRITTTHEHLDAHKLKRLAPRANLAAGPYVILSVSDTGMGISPENRGRIFDPFFTTKPGGQGLGLAATDGIVRAHAGTILVESTPRAGATFRVLLPVVEGAPAPEALRAPDTEPAPPPPADPETWRGSGIVLLADDEPDVRFVARRHLDRLGFDVVEVTNGGEAVERVRARPGAYVCVVLDFVMPVMNGAEAAAEIRALRPDLPVVIASGYTTEALGEKLGKAEIDAFIEKPFERARLAQALSRLLPRREDPDA